MHPDWALACEQAGRKLPEGQWQILAGGAVSRDSTLLTLIGRSIALAHSSFARPSVQPSIRPSQTQGKLGFQAVAGPSRSRASTSGSKGKARSMPPPPSASGLTEREAICLDSD